MSKPTDKLGFRMFYQLANHYPGRTLEKDNTGSLGQSILTLYLPTDRKQQS